MSKFFTNKIADKESICLLNNFLIKSSKSLIIIFTNLNKCIDYE